MIIQTINIDLYDWKIKIIYEANEANFSYIIKCLQRICDDKNLILQAKSHLLRDDVNSGFIYSSYAKHESIIIIGRTNSKSQLVNTVVHEASHLQAHIAEYYNLDRNGEDVCYLIAAIVQNIFDFITENM